MNEFLEQSQQMVSQMTLLEKASLCTGASYWTTATVERLGLGACVLSDGPHGVRRVKGKDHLGQSISERATGFPTSSAMGATWNCELMYEVGAALAAECQSIGVDILLGPAINMKRSVLGGRNFEYISEDPLLCGKLAASMVRGLQDNGVGACVKHFACNNSEHMRMTIDSVVDERTLREIYLKAFEIVVRESSPVSIMGSYNKVNGTYACENEKLLTQILRKEWGFDGLVLSDWLAVDDIVNAVQAGLNLEMPANGVVAPRLVQAVQSGQLAEAVLDQRVVELVAVVLKLQSARRRDTLIHWEKNSALALQVACEAAVLLKNNKALLPLELSRYDKIAIVGDFAKHPRSQGGGSSKVAAGSVLCAYEQLRLLSGEEDRFVYSQGYLADGETTDALLEDTLRVLSSCQIAVIFAGLPESYESEGYDRSSIEMPQGHIRLIETVAKACPNTIVVLNNGSAIAMPWADSVDAILECWLGGQAGASATAELLLGRQEPSGRLSETFPLRLEDDAAGVNFPGEEGTLLYGERMFIGYRHFEKQKIQPLFPFGFGLSYTQFEYSELSLDRQELDSSRTLKVSLTLRNMGSRPGSEVVQLYVAKQQPVLLCPVKELKSFQKVHLEPGQQVRLSFELDRDAFSCYDTIQQSWVVESGDYCILIAASSQDIRLSGRVSVMHGDCFVPQLGEKSMLMEWLQHPKGKLLAERMLANYCGFGIGVNGKTFAQLSQFVQRIMLEMPMPRLITASNGSFTEEDLASMLHQLEEI